MDERLAAGAEKPQAEVRVHVPSSSATWKNASATVQSAGVPPTTGSSMRASMGCTANTSAALISSATV
jgi:hypothetical protein